MPTYDYECQSCKQTFEIFHSINDQRKKCPGCGALRLKKLIGAGSGFLFKGSGFYITDYRNSDYKAKAASESGKASSESGKAASTDSSSGAKASAGAKEGSTGGATGGGESGKSSSGSSSADSKAEKRQRPKSSKD